MTYRTFRLMAGPLVLTGVTAVLAWGVIRIAGQDLSATAIAAQAPAAGARGQGRGQGAPAAPPAPCGPSAALAPGLAKNVAPNSRCFELRMYTADPTRDGVGQFKGGINELHQRFREKEVELFKKHGAEVIATWQSLGNSDTLIYMLAFRDRAHREEVWAAFNADPEWTALRTKYFVPLQTPNVTFMSATDYSPLK